MGLVTGFFGQLKAVVDDPLIKQARDGLDGSSGSNIDRENQAEAYFTKNKRVLIYIGGIAASFFLSPGFVIVGAGLGAGIKATRFGRENVFKWIDNSSDIINWPESILAIVGAAGAILFKVNDNALCGLAPLLFSGFALGSVCLDVYTHWGKAAPSPG